MITTISLVNIRPHTQSQNFFFSYRTFYLLVEKEDSDPHKEALYVES